MNNAKLKTLAQLRVFLEGSARVEFQPAGDERARCEHIESVLRRFSYARLKRADIARGSGRV